MVLKDWTKSTTGVHEYSWDNDNNEIGLYIIKNNKGLFVVKLWTTVGIKNLKTTNSKKVALKFARNYMKKETYW